VASGPSAAVATRRSGAVATRRSGAVATRRSGVPARPRYGQTAAVGRGRDNARVTFTRIAWLVTVLACIITGVALLLSGYQGYAAVFAAVGACAAINLR
jgi:hypothetical protein